MLEHKFFDLDPAITQTFDGIHIAVYGYQVSSFASVVVIQGVFKPGGKDLDLI